ncbi:MAG: sulfatase family protein [Armatimonadota bacterium]
MIRKNVILLHTDQQRADSLGCNGNPCVRTPNLDRLAAEGTTFTRHIVSNPICSPSRASLLTGLYPPGHNLWCNGMPLNRREYVTLNPANERVPADGGCGFVPEPATMADVFATAGYDTASFGKLHLTPFLAPESYGFPESNGLWRSGALADWRGPYYGFRYVETVAGHGLMPPGVYEQWMQREHPEEYRRVREDQPARPHPQIGDLFSSSMPFALHNTSWLADRLCAYLHERPASQPFFAFVGFPDPHHPFVPCDEILREFIDAPLHDPHDPDGAGQAGSPVLRLNQVPPNSIDEEAIRAAIRHTYAMVYQIDLAVGRILEALETLGLAEDTIVAFTSDHGDYLGDHGSLRKGYGASDSLLRVPFVLRAPGCDLPRQVETPMSNTDVLPTLASLAGVAPPAWQHGEDITQVVRAGQPHDVFAFAGNGDATSRNYTIYDDRYRLTWYPGADFCELFDHQADPGECRNIAGEPDQRERVGELKRRISEQLAASYNPIQGRVCAW